MDNICSKINNYIGPTGHRLKKIFWDILFCPIGPMKMLASIPQQAVEIIFGLLLTK